MLYKGTMFRVEDIDYYEEELEYSIGRIRVKKENGKNFENIDDSNSFKIAYSIGSKLKSMEEDDSFEIRDPEIIAILDREYKELVHDYDGISSRDEIIYEKVSDEEGNIYGREILTGSLFPIASDTSIDVKEYEVEKNQAWSNEIDFTLTITQSFKHRNYARLETILVDNEVASPNEIEEYKTRFDTGFRHEKKKEEFLRRIRENSNTNTLIDEVEVSVIKPKKKEKKQRETQDNTTKVMESIEYLIRKLKKINPEKAKEFNEKYEAALNEEDILSKRSISLATLISIEASLEFELMFTKGENTTLTGKLEELKKEYLTYFVTDSKAKTKITLDDLDKLMELFLKTKDNYSLIEQRKILRNFASVYMLEVKENESEVTLKRLEDSYFEDLKKSIMICIDALIENGFVESNMIAELSKEETTEEVLNLIRSLEFNKLSKEQVKELKLSI